jgi:hypothetical protein
MHDASLTYIKLDPTFYHQTVWAGNTARTSEYSLLQEEMINTLHNIDAYMR